MPERRPLALVTGSSAGIGRAVAVKLARSGYDVALTSRDTARLGEVVAEVTAAGGLAHPFHWQPEASTVGDVVDQIENELGAVDALVNNAAVLLRKSALDVSIEEWDSVFATNLRTPFLLAQAFARRAIAAGRRGAIVNLSSTHGRAVLAGRGVYGISKAAIDHLTRTLAVEWAPHGIRVNAVVPATVETESRRAALADPEVRAAMTSRIPLGRFGTPDEIAGAVRYLLAEDAGFITGACLLVDGGLTAT